MKKLILFSLIFMSLFTLYGCNQTKSGYYQLSSYGELETLLKDNQQNNYYYRDELGPVAGVEDSNSEKSTTNVQTAGIDEADVVKVDDTYIYYIYQNRLMVINHQTMTLSLDITLESKTNGYSYFSELYVYENRLVVLGYSYEYDVLFEDGNIMPYQDDAFDYQYFYFGRPTTTVMVFDISNLTLRDTYSIPGYLLSTRLKEDKLFVITNNYIYQSLDGIDYRPFFKVNDDVIIPEVSDIFTHELIEKSAFTVFSTIDLSEDTLDYQILLGPSYFQTIYFSEDRLYMTYYGYTYDEVNFTYETKGYLVSYDYENAFTFKGMAEFKGYLINQFSIDAYDGYVRLVTTDGWGDDIKNRLYIFKEDIETLTLAGKLETGIGKPRERVMSVRFNEDSVTVVTFEQIDPFYLIDLSEPSNPTILQSLEVPGYSLYQHPWATDVVLGIGYEVIDNRTTGIKLSLYDTSNIEALVEVGTPLVLSNQENSFQYGEALYNHKALLFDIDRGFFGFSVNRYYWNEYNYFYTHDYMIFAVDLESDTPITIEKVISHQNTNPDDYYNNGVNRAVYVGNYLYALSGLMVTKHDILADFNEVDQLLFD